jgi:hypothetical protein
VKKTLKEGWSNLHLNRIGGFLREARPVAMRIVGLNCQGLENDPKVSALLDIQRRYSPEVLFLSETHLDSYPVECLRRRSKMDFEIVNPTTTRSGVGVFLFWKREVKIEQIYSHPSILMFTLLRVQAKFGDLLAFTRSLDERINICPGIE